MNRFKSILAALCLLGFISCEEIEIPTYDIKDSAICFSARSSQFSLRGLTGDYMDVEIPMTLIGPVCDYDRQISIAVEDASGNTAVEGSDFTILDHIVKAGETKGLVTLRLKRFSEGVTNLRTTLKVIADENFREGYPTYCSAVVDWSEEYARPEVGVWRYWYLYLSHGYSRDYHKLLLEIFGEEIETVTGAKSYVTANPSLVMKMPTWWYEASRTLYTTVKEHDLAHPDDPYMHSADYQLYTGYNTAVGEGMTPKEIPTILETLETL